MAAVRRITEFSVQLIFGGFPPEIMHVSSAGSQMKKPRKYAI
jgi:hypothetical protein